ncbi:HAD-IA family hydrolase [Altererythrobacter sp. SALINAS58]|uniref:HAD-IA family hydrolase n=1 Tax=Alteripontixanthobacter muriae TaxID=2705546 RepID=UPI0015755F77|nr:HAD-IA family hydrolase [Alteripontixanthobacter muriae]NTZ42273.1 HAD-IA family hydrolase [Alteripontixanthobacter muriae]
MSRKLAVFDCDGTLVDGQAAICSAMDNAFAEAGLQAPDHHQVRRIVGLSLPGAVRLLAPSAPAEVQAAVVAGYKQAFRNSRLEGRLEEPLFPGIRELVANLRRDGWAVAIATGKSDRGLTSCLEVHGMGDWFVSLQTADRHPSKPDPAMLHAAMLDASVDASTTVMIGDTTYDMEMAANAGVRAIGVGWGYHDSAELTEAGASGVAGDMDSLERILRDG